MKKAILFLSLAFGCIISANAYNQQSVSAVAGTPNYIGYMNVGINAYCNMVHLQCTWDTGVTSGSAQAYGDDILIGEVYGATGSYSSYVSTYRYWTHVSVYISSSGSSGATGTAILSWW